MRILAAIGALAIVGALAEAVFFFGGFYNVAGAALDLGIVRWALVRVRTSIDRHADAQTPSGMDDPAESGAARVRSRSSVASIVTARPGWKWATSSKGLHPDPPDLKDLANSRTPWHNCSVIKNGMNMTGMPNFALAGAKDEQLWAIAAFVKKLPSPT